MNYNNIRRKTPEVSIGKVTIGGHNPIAIQSMTNTMVPTTETIVNIIPSLPDASEA